MLKCKSVPKMLKFIFGFSLEGESLFPCKSRNWAKIESFEVFFVGPKSNSWTESCDESFGFFKVQFKRVHPSVQFLRVVPYVQCVGG